MKNKRREFLKLGGLAGVAVTNGSVLKGVASVLDNYDQRSINFSNPNTFPMADR